jgi:hypothetical protein
MRFATFPAAWIPETAEAFPWTPSAFPATHITPLEEFPSPAAPHRVTAAVALLPLSAPTPVPGPAVVSNRELPHVHGGRPDFRALLHRRVRDAEAPFPALDALSFLGFVPLRGLYRAPPESGVSPAEAGEDLRWGAVPVPLTRGDWLSIADDHDAEAPGPIDCAGETEASLAHPESLRRFRRAAEAGTCRRSLSGGGVAWFAPKRAPADLLGVPDVKDRSEERLLGRTPG